MSIKFLSSPWRRYLKKTIIIIFLVIMGLVITTATLSYIYKDKIIRLVVNELNKKLTTKVNVEKIDLSVWDKFPSIAVRFQHIEIEESITPTQKPLLKAAGVFFTFNLLSVLRGKYKVNQLYIEDGEAFIRIDKLGKYNYNIFKRSSEASTGEINFDLQEVQLKNINITYSDQLRNQEYSGHTDKIKARLNVKGPDIGIVLDGHLYVSGIKLGNDIYFAKKDLILKGNLNYNQDNNKLSISPSSFTINNSRFKVYGSYLDNSSNLIDLNVEGENTDIQTILSFLPSSISGKFAEYKSEGIVYFKARVAGAIKKASNPYFNINFGCTNTSFYHPSLKQKIERASFTGSFSNGKLRNYATSELKITNASGLFDGKKFKGNLLIEDFGNPYLAFDLEANIDVHSLLQFYPMENIKSANGIFNVAVDFKGQVSSLKKYSASKQISASGEIEVKNLSFILKQRDLSFNSFNGNFIFSKNDLAVNDFSGKVGNSDFLLNGLFRNVISYILIPNQSLGIDAELKSDFLDIDELLQDDKASQQEDAYNFKISPDLILRLDCNIRKATFRKFTGKNIKGKVNLKDQQASFNDISLNASGGKAEFDGTLDAQRKDFIQIETTSKYQNIYIDSLFYVFEDFKQNFISYKNLRGQFSSDIKSYLVVNSKLEPDYDRITAYISGSIKNGELVKFEPLQKLSRFVDDEALANLKFSELKNVIQIHKRTVYIPDMEIGSNVSNISLHGTHTFDQEIDYRLRVPLRNFRKKDKDEAFGAIEEDGTGKSALFIIIKGTADNYKISYDRGAVKEKIKKDLNREKQEFMDIFKKKEPPKEREKELSGEEYFEF